MGVPIASAARHWSCASCSCRESNETSSSTGTAVSICARNFLNSTVRWRACSDPMTFREAMSNAANRLLIPERCSRLSLAREPRGASAGSDPAPHNSTYYACKRQVDRDGLEMLRPRERRRPQMPNALPKMIEERIVSFSIAHPGLGPRRVASELAREKWGGS